MKRSPRITRTPSELSQSVHERLNMYALAASAAGVGTLVLAHPAEAKIVYTPTHVIIGLHGSYKLDLNHDGKTDFNFLQSFFISQTYGESYQEILTVVPLGENQVIGGVTQTQINSHYAVALAPGVRIGPKGRFSKGPNGMAWFGTGFTTWCGGHWFDVKNRYLGLEFRVKGKLHYGWARLNVTCTTSQRKATGTLTGYAYETIPNKPIIAGKTHGTDDAEPAPASVTKHTPEQPTLGMLALGSLALSIWRREEVIRNTTAR
jgi:hypothetical protein